MKISRLTSCVLGLTVALASAAHAPKLTFKFTNANVSGAAATLVAEINNRGVMVGQYLDSNGVLHGYILDGKNLTTLDDPNGTGTFVSGINFNGPIALVGYYTNSSGNSVGFRYSPRTKKFTDIPNPKGATSLWTGGMNDRGWIVGYYQDSNGVVHGFLLQGKKYKVLDVPGTLATYAYGINNQGYVTLTWVDSKYLYEGALYNGTTYQVINVPGAPGGSEASFINNQNDVTFWWLDSAGYTHGALCPQCDSKGRKFYKFDYPKSVATYPGGINDKNAIVGQYQDTENGPASSFEATWK